MTWEDLTVEQFEQLQQIEKLQLDEYERSILVCQTLFQNKEFSLDMPFKELNEYVGKLGFLKDMPKIKGNVKSVYVVDGNGYYLTKNLEDFTTAQYIDYQQHLKDKASLAVVLSAILIPLGHKYAKGYNMQDAQNELQNMCAIDALNIAFFLQKRATKYTRTLLNSSIRKAMRMMIAIAWKEWLNKVTKKKG